MVSVVLALGVVTVQAVTGALWWGLAVGGRRMSVPELAGMGLALGTFVSMISAVVLRTTVADPVGWAVPTLLTIVAVLVRPRAARARLPHVGTGAHEWIATAVGLGAGLVLLLANWIRLPLPGPEPTVSPDLYFFEALSRGIAAFGPGESILMSDGALRYHWFTYGWAGELAQTAGTEPFVLLTRVLPVVTLVGATALSAAWAARLTRIRWVPTLAVLLVVVGGYTGALYGAILNFDSPSQALTTVWLLALTIAFVEVARRGGTGLLVVVAVLASASTGGKASHALVAAGGMGLATVVGLATRQPWGRRALVATIVAGIAMAGTYLVVLSGVAVDANLTEEVAVKASTYQGLDPITGPAGVALGTAALVLAVLTRVVGLGWLLARRPARPEVLVTSGGVAVGLLAMVLLSEGINELWFVLAASAPAAVVASVGVGRALTSLRRPPTSVRRPLLWAVAVAVPASVVTLLLTRPWPTGGAVLNWLAPVSVWILVPLTAAIALAATRRATLAGVLALSVGALTLTSILTRPASLWTADRTVTTETGTVVAEVSTTGSDVAEAPANATWIGVPFPERYAAWAEAARWVDENTPVTAVLATSNVVGAEVPALAGRQMYLAGMAYQSGLGRAGDQAEVEERAAASAGFTNDPRPETAGPLCEAGVEWVWLERDTTGLPASAVAFANDIVTIVRLPGWACASG